MNVFDLLIGNTGQALQLVFQLGFLPVEENFLELTDEQYRQFSAEVGGVDEKLYMIVTSNGQDILDDDYNEISVVTESEKNGFLNATAIIKNIVRTKIWLLIKKNCVMPHIVYPIVFRKVRNLKNIIIFLLIRGNKVNSWV